MYKVYIYICTWDIEIEIIISANLLKNPIATAACLLSSWFEKCKESRNNLHPHQTSTFGEMMELSYAENPSVLKKW